MSWVALLAGAPVWVALCSAMDTAGGPVEGAIVGACFWLLIAGGRFWLEWTDGYGNVGALRKRLSSTTTPDGVSPKDTPLAGWVTDNETRGQSSDE